MMEQVASSPSRTFGWLLGAFVVGVSLGVLLMPDVLPVLWMLGLSAAAAIAIRSPSARFVALLLTCVAFGLWRTDAFRVHNGFGPFFGSTLVVEGTVVSEPVHSTQYVRVTLARVSVDHHVVDGRLLATASDGRSLGYGDRVQFSCALRAPEPFNGFAYDQYLANQGIFALCDGDQMSIISQATGNVTRFALQIKQHILSRLNTLVPEPEASFLGGLLFGGTFGLPDGLRDDFTRTGTSHLLAASGFNVSLVSAVFLGWILQTPLGRKRALLTAFLLLALYVLAAGATPAVTRAGIFGIVAIWSKALGRRASVPNAFLLAAAVLLCVNPRLITDIGFQLSFVATAAMLWASAPLHRVLSFVPEAYGIRDAIAGSLAAIVFTLPFTLWHFGVLSLVAPFTNLIVLPFIPLLMALATVAIVVSYGSFFLGTGAVFPAWAIAFLLLHVVHWEAAVSFASVDVSSAHTAAMVAALILIFLVWRFAPRVSMTHHV